MAHRDLRRRRVVPESSYSVVPYGLLGDDELLRALGASLVLLSVL